MLLRIFFSLSIIFLLSACAPPKLSLTLQAQQNIDQADHVLIIPQNNLDITVQATNPGNSGIIGALIAAAIDSARQSSAEENAAPIIKKPEDYDFRSVMKNSLLDLNKSNTKINFNESIKVYNIDSESQKKLVMLALKPVPFYFQQLIID